MHRGLLAHGIDAKISYSYLEVKSRYVACWGWRQGALLRQRGHEVLVMERAYLGDRFKWTSLAWNGLNGHGRFPDIDAPSRFKENFQMQPWKKGGDYALILGQVVGDASLKGQDMKPWYERKAAEVKAVHGIPVHFRIHPEMTKRGKTQFIEGTVKSSGSLDEALSGAAFTIAYNSNSGVDSVLAGIPSQSFDTGSMAWPVTGHEVSEVLRPDREEWAEKLAWKQWKPEEIASGEAVKYLLDIAA